MKFIKHKDVFRCLFIVHNEIGFSLHEQELAMWIEKSIILDADFLYNLQQSD